MPEALVINDTTYAGTVASYMITRAVVGADTIQKGCAYVKDGIDKQYTIPRIEISNFMQRRQATPTSQGTVTVDGQVLVPKDMMLYYEFNPRDFEAHWYAEQLKPQLLARDLPQTVEAYMVMQQMKRLNEWFENAYWKSRIQYDTQGSAVDPTTKGAAASDAQYFYFDGLIKRLLDGATVPPVGQRTILVSSPLPLTDGASSPGVSENIIEALNRAYNLVPDALIGNYGPTAIKFMLNYKSQKMYEQALASNTYKNQDTTERGINRYKGYDVVPLAGIPDNTIVVCKAMPDLASNVWIGINSTQDNQLQIAKLQANSELYFIKGLFKADTQFGFYDQAVLYTTLTA